MTVFPVAHGTLHSNKRVFTLTVSYASEPVRENAGKEEAKEHNGVEGAELSLLWVIPFVGILLSIALLPLFKPSFWHHHFGKVSLFWALAIALPYLLLFKNRAFHDISHIFLIDYIPFIILLWGLFTAAGGILLKGDIPGTPLMNTIMLLIGTLIASWIGTTGAAMLLIRPMIRSNASRQKKTHVVIFFIFLVCNIGGSLTPLGDPPLFLGFLHGVPFFWTTIHLFLPMSFAALLLLIIFYSLDSYYYKKEPETEKTGETEKTREPVSVEGLHNIIFLMGIMGAVLLSGLWNPHKEFNILGVHVALQNIARDVLIVVMGILSMKTTRKETREANGFTWFPIQEVAILFAGIFMTIIPALSILYAGEHGPLGFLIRTVKTPAHYFWITGILSSFLDNAPTYLTFYTSALGKLSIAEAQVSDILRQNAGMLPVFLKAISVGAVFMGANTYIGNAPNFMVRSIAEENNVEMPSFIGYMLWSVSILIPIFILVSLVFF